MDNAATFTQSGQQYARFRPAYPAELYTYLASAVDRHGLAWDCSTGSGQAAVGLAPHFEQIIATDSSAEQIAHASLHDKVTYRIMSAEAADIADASVDLVTVAQALHWFDLDRFYAEVTRVLKPGGAIAAWAYDRLHITPEIDNIIEKTMLEPIYSFWSHGNHLIFAQYRTIPFPFAELTAPAFAMEMRWSLTELLGYFSTWSAVRRSIADGAGDPVLRAKDDIGAAWGDAETRRSIRMPLHLRVGRTS